MKKILLIISVLNIYLGCSQKKEENIEKNNLMRTSNNNVEIILRQQLEKGISGEVLNSFDIETYTYSKEDMEAVIPVAEKIILSQGYIPPSNKAFSEKVQMIFKRKIDFNLSSKYLYLNFNEKCDKEVKYYRNDKSVDVTPYSYYIIKNSNFLTELYAIPELIDYKNAYPKLAEFEKKSMEKYMEDGDEVKIYKWKDVADLKEQRQNNIQILVNRNKYLFNDDRASFVWLRSNDTWFLESLVKTFGYVEDKALLDFVLKRNYKDLAELEKIMINCPCGGKNRLNTEVFAVVKGWKKKELSDFSFRIQELMYTLIKKEEQGKSEIDFPELTKILSETAYHMSKTDEDSYYNFFPILNLTEKYREEIEKKNFYNNPDLKRVWEETKTGGRWRPGMEEASLKKETLKTITLYPRPDLDSIPKQLEISSEDIEYLHKVSDWDFVRVPHMVGYLAPENLKKHSFLAEEDFTLKEQKGFWDKLFG